MPAAAPGGVLLAVAVAAAVLGALVFEPRKLVVDERVQEAPPAVQAGGATGSVVLARGTFVGHEHDTGRGGCRRGATSTSAT